MNSVASADDESMPTFKSTLFVMIAAAGCSDLDTLEIQPVLEITPSELDVTIINGKPVSSTFTATLVDANGERRDVTSSTTFSLVQPGLGSWSGSALTLGGAAAGEARVVATRGDGRVEADLRIYSRSSIVTNGPADAAAKFGRATDTDFSCAPAITYPALDAVVPSDLGVLEVKWQDERNDLFEVTLSTTYVDVRLYTRKLDGATPWATIPSSLFTHLTSQHEPIEVAVNGIASGASTQLCKGASRLLYTTNEPLGGTLYFGSDTGLWRHDPTSLHANARKIGPATYGVCVGCTVSRDGSRIALSRNALGTKGQVFDVVGDSLEPVAETSTRTWTTGTLAPDGSRLIADRNEELDLLRHDNAHIGTLSRSPSSSQAIQPQLSADGRWLANVEITLDSTAFTAAIVVREVDLAGDSFGPARTVIGAQPNALAVAPAWSPDGEWLAFTRITDWGTSLARSSIWVARKDGSKPVQVTKPGLDMEVAAHWAPYPLTVGPDDQPLYYLAFTDGEDGQIWIKPFFPTTLDASSPATRLPFQSTKTRNWVIGWSTGKSVLESGYFDTPWVGANPGTK